MCELMHQCKVPLWVGRCCMQIQLWLRQQKKEPSINTWMNARGLFNILRFPTAPCKHRLCTYLYVCIQKPLYNIGSCTILRSNVENIGFQIWSLGKGSVSGRLVQGIPSSARPPGQLVSRGEGEGWVALLASSGDIVDFPIALLKAFGCSKCRNVTGTRAPINSKYICLPGLSREGPPASSLQPPSGGRRQGA